jgi:hypothetical protein
MLDVKDDPLGPTADPVLRVLASPEEDEHADDPLRTYLREIHEVNQLPARDQLNL